MSTLTLSAALRAELTAAFRALPGLPDPGWEALRLLPDIDAAIADRPAIGFLARTLKAVLAETGFVHLLGVPDSGDYRGPVAVGRLLGSLFTDADHQPGLVVEASPVPSAALQGNKVGGLFPHTDFAMLDRPPAVTVIRCAAAADPLGPPLGANGVMVAQDIVDRFLGTDWLPLLWSVPVPFAGRTPAGLDVTADRPVIELGTDYEVLGVRFHPSRIHHGFRVRGRGPAPDEVTVLGRMIDACLAVRQEVHLASGDYLLIDNRRVLHDRGRCSLEVSENTLRARRTQILFVQETGP
jgi:alpha-ketoglutarate-dependent taurine dioxygenase